MSVSLPEFADGLTFEEYQERAIATAIYPGKGEGNIIYPALGLTGEAGEVAEKVKKILRDGGGEWTHAQSIEIAKELGDVLWYINAMAEEIGFDLNFIAAMNIAKLESRQQRGKLQGSGDER